MCGGGSRRLDFWDQTAPLAPASAPPHTEDKAPPHGLTGPLGTCSDACAPGKAAACQVYSGSRTDLAPVLDLAVPGAVTDDLAVGAVLQAALWGWAPVVQRAVLTDSHGLRFGCSTTG